MIHRVRKNCAVAGLVNAAEPLHDGRRQADLIAGDRAATARPLDLLECFPDRVGLVEIGRVKLGRQHLDGLAVAEQLDDPLGLLPWIEGVHLIVP